MIPVIAPNQDSSNIHGQDHHHHAYNINIGSNQAGSLLTISKYRKYHQSGDPYLMFQGAYCDTVRQFLAFDCVLH